MKSVKLILFVLILLCLCACTAKDQENAPAGVYYENNLNETFGWINYAEVMDGADETLKSTVNTDTLDEIEASVSSESGEVYQMVYNALGDSSLHEEIYAYGWTGKCYISDVAIPFYSMSEDDIGDTYILLAFSEDMSEIMKISLWKSDGEYSWKYSRITDKEKRLIRNYPDKEFIFVDNAGLVAIDQKNVPHILEKDNGSEFQVEGDFFHALDCEALAVTYSEISVPEHLHEIIID